MFNQKIPTWRSRCFLCQGQSQVIQPEPQVFPQCTQKICKGFASKNIVNNKYKHLYWDTPLCDCVREKVDFSQIRTKIFERTLEGLWEFYQSSIQYVMLWKCKHINTKKTILQYLVEVWIPNNFGNFGWNIIAILKIS